MPKRFFLELVGAVVVAVVGIARPTTGQETLPSAMLDDLEAAFVAGAGPADLPALTETLRLDAGQQDVVSVLLADHARAFEKAARRQQARLAAVRAEAVPTATRARDLAELRTAAARLAADARREAGQTTDAEARRRALADYHEHIRELQSRLRARDAAAPGAAAAPLEQIARETAPILTAWSAQRQALRRQLEEDVRSILTDEQRGRWPLAERRLRREHGLRRGVLSGESIDVVAVLAELEVPVEARAAIAPAVERCEQLVDAVLQARDANEAEARARLGRDPDPEAVHRLQARRVELRVAVRDVNLDQADRLAAALPPENAVRFVDVVRGRSFPSVYRPTRETRLFEAALHLDDLDDATFDAVEDLQREYTTALRPLNATYRRAILADEPVRLRRRLAGAVDDGEDPVRAARSERRALGDRYAARLFALLGPARTARLPGGGAEGGGDGLIAQEWVRERFDRDRDGVLDAEEMERLRTFLRDREK